MAETVNLDAHLVYSNSGTVGLDAIIAPPNVEKRLTIGLNLRRNAPYQWNKFDFNSFAVFNGVPISSNEDGIFSLFDADNDDGGDIDAFFELPTTNLNIPNPKKMRKAYVNLETSGPMMLKATTDEFNEASFALTPRMTGQKQHMTHPVPMRRDQKGVYWMFRMENTNGCDFSIDSVFLSAFILGMGR